MRIAVAILLALVAIAAGTVWGIGQFGSTSTFESVPREPVVREAQEVAVVTPAATPQARSLPTPDQTPAAPAEPGQPAAEPTEPQQANPPPVTFRSTLQEQQPPVSNPDSTTPSSDPAPATEPAQPAEAEARVSTQQAGVSQAAAPSGLESQFQARRVTYNRPPEKLALNKAVDVSLVVNATDDEAAGREALEGFKGEIVERDVELSDTVSAQLTGVGFDITTQTVERQRLSGRTVNRWQWRVTPTEPGQHTLILEIFGYATGSLDAEPLDAYRDVITVEVEQIDQLVTWAKGVQPLFAVLAALAGIGSAIFAFLRFREEKKQTKASRKPEA
jgi:hypothetical protein